MKTKYDFSKGVRGKFHNPNGEFNLPIYLEAAVANLVQKRSVNIKAEKQRVETEQRDSNRREASAKDAE
jgi:hypothetical protein